MAYRRDQPRAPKPYDFVPIAPLENQDRTMPRGHEKYYEGTVSGRLEATLIVATPLHVASGQLELRSGDLPLVRAITRVNGQPCIPASTLKGVVRSVVEAITQSCVRITRARELPKGVSGCRNKQNLCLTCRMFGALGFEGHVRFSDAILKDTEEEKIKVARMPALYQPRSKTRAYFDRSGTKGRKFYKHGRTILSSQTPIEIITPESQLSFTVRFENLTKAELGVLLTALGLGHPSLVLKLGGGKPACYGSAVALSKSLVIWENVKSMYSDYGVEDKEVTPELYLEAAEDLILKPQLKKLAELWKYDMRRYCPEGNY